MGRRAPKSLYSASSTEGYLPYVRVRGTWELDNDIEGPGGFEPSDSSKPSILGSVQVHSGPGCSIMSLESNVWAFREGNRAWVPFHSAMG